MDAFQRQHDGKDYHTVFMGVCQYCNKVFAGEDVVDTPEEAS